MTRKKESWIDDLRRERLKGSSRNPGSAALMSFFVMGLGQIYAGHIDRGIMLMSIYFSSLFGAVSIYNGGIVYDAVFPLLGAHLMVVLSYIVSVVFILLWIYNIKDAYYLSLFSSFRDWFEVERVLLPAIQAQSEDLISGPSRVSGLLAAPLKAPPAVASATEHEDADVVEVESACPDEDEQVFEPGQVVYAADFGAMKMSGQSWKVYFGLVLIFVLIGLWLEKRETANAQNITNSETLFAFAGDLKNTRNDVNASATDLLSASVTEVSLPATVSSPIPFSKGMEQVRLGNYADAAKLFEADLTANEPQKDDWRIILNSFYRADSIVAYELNLRRYLSKFPEDAAAWFNLGKLLYDRQELAQASQSIVRGLRIEPENVRGNYLLGSIYIDLKLYNDSIAYLERSLALEPLNIDFNRQLARALNQAGRVEESKRFFQRILSLSPDDVEAAQAATINPVIAENQSKVLVVQGNTEARLVDRQIADAGLIPEPSPVPASGKVLFEASPVAVPESQPALTEQPTLIEQPTEAVSPEIPDQPVKTSVEPVKTPEPPLKITDKPDKTSDQLVKTPNKPDKTPDKSVKNQDKLIGIEVKAPVIAKTSEKAEIPTVAAVINADKANNADDADNAENSDKQFRDTVAQEKRVNAEGIRIEELRKKGASEFSRGNWEVALPSYLEVLKFKRDAQTYDMVGVIFEKLSMHKDAFEAIEHAYRLGRKDSATLNKLGRLAETTGNFNKGEFYLSRALQKSPHRVDLRIRYAKCLDANNKPDNAIAELEKIIRGGKDSYAVRRRAELEISKIKSARK